MGAMRRLTARFVESAAAVAVVRTAVDFGVAADAGLIDRAEEAVGGHGKKRGIGPPRREGF